jgi:hypothetical protein
MNESYSVSPMNVHLRPPAKVCWKVGPYSQEVLGRQFAYLEVDGNEVVTVFGSLQQVAAVVGVGPTISTRALLDVLDAGHFDPPARATLLQELNLTAAWYEYQAAKAHDEEPDEFGGRDEDVGRGEVER